MKKNNDENIECKDCKQLKTQIEQLNIDLEKKEAERFEIENQLKKALADYHNLVSNSEKRNEIRYFQTKKNLVESMIPALDALSMAFVSGQSLNFDENGKAWLQGIKAISETMSKALVEVGLTQYIPNKGDKFDASMHEAIATVPEGNSGEIYDLVQPGYILDNTVVRPARVVVSK